MDLRTGDSFFTLDGDWYRPTPHTRGPWDEGSCHGGPPTGAIARELELLVDGARLTRLSVDLLRPVPFAGFRIESEVRHHGRTVTSTAAQLFGEDGRVCARANGLHLTPVGPLELPTVPPSHPGGRLEDARPDHFPLKQTLHGLAAFNGDGVATQFPEGESPTPGPTTMWMKTVPLLPDEPTSPFQRMCPLADCGNAISRNAEPQDINFINPDLTLVLHRDPIGEWLGSQSTSHWQPDGTGLADSLLFDEQGVVGRALQTLILRPSR